VLAALLAASSSGWPAVAALYGSLVAVLGTLLQRRHAKRAERVAGLDPRRNLGVLLRCELERLLLASVMLAIGLAVLRMPGLPLLGAFLLVTVVPVFETSIERLTKRWQAIRKP
jgi:F0F1-type ATP synthase assembly protein I